MYRNTRLLQAFSWMYFSTILNHNFGSKSFIHLMLRSYPKVFPKLCKHKAFLVLGWVDQMARRRKDAAPFPLDNRLRVFCFGWGIGFKKTLFLWISKILLEPKISFAGNFGTFSLKASLVSLKNSFPGWLQTIQWLKKWSCFQALTASKGLWEPSG